MLLHREGILFPTGERTPPFISLPRMKRIITCTILSLLHVPSHRLRPVLSWEEHHTCPKYIVNYLLMCIRAISTEGLVAPGPIVIIKCKCSRKSSIVIGDEKHEGRDRSGLGSQEYRSLKSEVLQLHLSPVSKAASWSETSLAWAHEPVQGRFSRFYVAVT